MALENGFAISERYTDMNIMDPPQGVSENNHKKRNMMLGIFGIVSIGIIIGIIFKLKVILIGVNHSKESFFTVCNLGSQLNPSKKCAQWKIIECITRYKRRQSGKACL